MQGGSSGGEGGGRFGSPRGSQGPPGDDPGSYGPASGNREGFGPPGGGPGGFVAHLDRDGDGRVSREEFDGPPDRFDFHDANRDGYLTEDEAPPVRRLATGDRSQESSEKNLIED